MEKKIVLKDGAVISTDSEIRFYPTFISFRVTKDNELVEHLFNLALANKCDITEFTDYYHVILQREEVKEFKINNK